MSVLQSVTIIVATGYVDQHDLNAKDLNTFKRLIRRIFKKHAPDATGLFVIDISFNLEEGLNRKNHWQVHFHGIIHNISKDQWILIRKQLQKTSGNRSLFIRDAYEPIGKLAYMAKPNFSQRIAITNKKGDDDTRKIALTLKHELELNEWLSYYSVESRIIEIGDFGDESLK